MVKLGIFDVDFTITSKETLMQFFRYMIMKDKKNLKFLPRALGSGFLYGIKVFDERRVKESFLKFIDGIEEKDLADIVRGFYKDKLKEILYKDGIDMIKKLKKEGYQIYLISASPEFYLNEFYDIKEVDHIIGTRFNFEKGKFKRIMEGKNCKGEEKVERLKNYLKENNIDVDFKNSYMFSDSLSDKPLLDLVGNPYLINFKKKSEIKILNWK